MGITTIHVTGPLRERETTYSTPRGPVPLGGLPQRPGAGFACSTRQRQAR